MNKPPAPTQSLISPADFVSLVPPTPADLLTLAIRILERIENRRRDEVALRTAADVQALWTALKRCLFIDRLMREATAVIRESVAPSAARFRRNPLLPSAVLNLRMLRIDRPASNAERKWALRVECFLGVGNALMTGRRREARLRIGNALDLIAPGHARLQRRADGLEHERQQQRAILTRLRQRLDAVDLELAAAPGRGLLGIPRGIRLQLARERLQDEIDEAQWRLAGLAHQADSLGGDLAKTRALVDALKRLEALVSRPFWLRLGYRFRAQRIGARLLAACG